MPIMRNPFRRGEAYADEGVYPAHHTGGAAGSNGGDIHKVPHDGAKPLKIKIKSDRSPTEYKLSEINDSGVFLPPSPIEKENSFWSASTRSSSHRSVFSENEPFSISRESFDSYRRSFDISARSPVLEGSPTQRKRPSLDVRQTRLPPSSYAYAERSQRGSPPQAEMRRQSEQLPLPRPQAPLSDRHINPIESQPEERFEDVGLGDESHAIGKHAKKRGIFARFGESTTTTPGAESSEMGNATGLGHHTRPSSSHGISGMMTGHIFGRKRGQSGQGAELGGMKRDMPAPADVKTES